MREQIEPEGFFDDTQDETRPALENEARKALDMANARRKSLAPLIDKDAETAALMPNEIQGYQAALERLKQQRMGQSQPPSTPPSVPPPDKTTRDRERSDPAFALAQLTAQRQSGGTAPPPPMSRPPTNANGFQPAGMQRPSTNPNGTQLQRPPTNPNGTGPNRPLSMESASAIPSARDLAANVRRSLVDAKPSSSPSGYPPAPVTDDPDVIKSLLGGPAPAAPRLPQDPLAMSGGTTPMKLADLGLKPATGNIPLAPQRTPAPMAVVGKGVGVMVTDRPGSMPPAGFGFPKTTPSAQAPMRPQMPSRPPGAFGPPPGSSPPKQYDFKRWSSPDISEMPDDGSPVTFQVYTAQDVAQGRGPMRSMPMIEAQPKSGGSIAMKVGLAVLGGIIVLITAAAVIMVSTDEPKKPVDAVPPPPPTSAAPSVTVAPEPAPTPTVLVIPGDVPEEPATTATTATPKKAPKAPTGGGAPAPKPAPPPVTPPPNPYGKP